MKKLLIVISSVLCLFFCTKKDYICTCISDLDGTTVECSHYNLTAEDAESSCENRNNEPGISCSLEEL